MWTYLPGPRPGVAVGDLDDAARGGLDELLGVTLSAMGADRTRQVMNLDDVLREVERSVGRTGWERRSSERYWVRVLGDPDDEVWAWHLGGHHVASTRRSSATRSAMTPVLPRGQPGRRARRPACRSAGVARGGALARELLGALEPTSARWRWSRPDAPDDIATRHDPVADPDLVPSGVRHDALDRSQARAARGAGAVVPGARAGGGGRARPGARSSTRGSGEVTFAWAGSHDSGRAALLRGQG